MINNVQHPNYKSLLIDSNLEGVLNMSQIISIIYNLKKTEDTYE